MKNAVLSVFAVILVLIFSQRLDAFLPGGPIGLTMDVVVNPMAGSPQILCKVHDAIEQGSDMDWWVSVSAQASDSNKQMQSLDSPVICGSGAFEWPDTDVEDQEKAEHLVSSGSIVAVFIPQMENELIVSLQVSADVKLQVKGDHLSARYEKSNIERKFLFAENQEVFIPLFVANSEQQKALGVREVFLRFELSEHLAEPESVYGVIWINSDLAGADVLLDGGLVGSITSSGDFFLRNISAGLHEVGVRTAKGVSVRKAVRVRANRTVLAELNPVTMTPDMAPFQLKPLGPNEHGYQEYIRGKDGAIVIKVPEGEFLMGNVETEGSPLEHNVNLSTYLIDKTGVTWDQYKVFAEATGIHLPPHDPYWGIRDDHPAVYVTWAEANNYCAWAGGRLPTEAEREKAARGTDGRKYPWGNVEPTPQLATFRKSWGYHSTSAVGQHPAGASPYGLLDVGGNVWEWCADWYDKDYYEISPYHDPKGPASGVTHVVRGGSWDSRPTVLSSSCRSWGHVGYRDGDFGFRCAMNSPE